MNSIKPEAISLVTMNKEARDGNSFMFVGSAHLGERVRGRKPVASPEPVFYMTYSGLAPFSTVHP